MRKLRFIGTDYWSRPVYRDEKGKLWKDVELGKGTPYLHRSANDDFEGEPDYPLTGEYEIVGKMEDYPGDSPCNTCINAGAEKPDGTTACTFCFNHEFYSAISKEAVDE